MHHSLGSHPSLAAASGPDLRATLAARRRTQRDVRVAASDLKAETRGGAWRLRFGGETATPTIAVADELARKAGLEDRHALAREPERLEDALSRESGLLVRLEGGAVRAVLPGDCRLVDNLELVDATLGALKKISHEVRVDICDLEEGELHVALVAPGLARDVREGDYLYGGFFLASSETTLADTEACVRIFRVACRNGALADAAEGQRLVLPRRLPAGQPDPYPTWQARLSDVVERAFDGGAMDEETERFRATTDEMLASPYEFLLNLVAQGLITEDEQSSIQRAFDEAGDSSLYGLVNAVTSIAHRLRGDARWSRAFAIERLGGEIVRGDHRPPVGSPVWA